MKRTRWLAALAAMALTAGCASIQRASRPGLASPTPTLAVATATETASATAPPTETPTPSPTCTATPQPTATGTPPVTATMPRPSRTASPRPTPLPAAGGDWRFGVVETYQNSVAATQLGAGWTRVIFQWSGIQPDHPGQWNDAELEAVVNSELAAGREVVGLIVVTPAWALRNSKVAGVPGGLDLPTDDPQNLWAQFLRRLTTQFAKRVNHWIIWNEPDIWDCSYPGQTWGGSAEEFLQFQRVAYSVAKSTDPNAVVHLAGMTYWWDTQYGRTPFFERFLDALQADPNAAQNNRYFDVATSHQYFRPDTVYDLTAWLHQKMRDRGFDKPVWIVETNAAPSTDPAWPVLKPMFNITLEDQAAFIIQGLAMGLASGAERIAVFKMADTAGDSAANPEPFGLVRMDGSRRPAFAAFQLAASYFAGYRSATLDRRDQVTQVTIDRGEQRTVVLWSRVGPTQRITLRARADSAWVVDSRTGIGRTLGAVDGQYQLDLPGSACTQPVADVCLIGGWPLLVIERSQ